MSQLSLDDSRITKLRGGRMLVGLSGWMNGGDVSTGTVAWLQRVLAAPRIGQIDPAGFYIYNFPGSMEIAALFRPNTSIVDGVIRTYELPENTFYCDRRGKLLLFSGKEPNLNWEQFADCIFSAAERLGVGMLYFVGSYSGAVPHTREPRLFSTVSSPDLRAELERRGARFTDYEGPASFSTHLLACAQERGLQMASLVAEIPAYIQGPNPKCIEAVIRQLVVLLGLQLDLTELRTLTAAWEQRINEVLEEKADLSGHIHKLEEDYDNEVFDTQMGDLKEWLEQQGIRVD